MPLQKLFDDALGDSPGALLVALSGGLDSCALLELAWRYHQQHPDVSVCAVHVHHGLSPNADAWAAHCQALCRARDIPLHTEKVHISLQPRQSLEAEARRVRYQVLTQQLPPGGVLLTGHHLDDQAETLLLMLKRGAGPRGLSAMAARTGFAHGELVRPLLGVSRDELEQFARAQKLQWIDDESNRDSRFDRNFLRHEILPQLKQRWPGVTQAIARSAELCAEQELLLVELAESDLEQAQRPENSLCCDTLLGLSLPRRNNLLRHWLRTLGAPAPSRVQLAQVSGELLTARQDANPELHWQGRLLRRYRQRLYLISGQQHRPEVIFLSSPGQGFRHPGPGQQLEVRYALPGKTRCHPVDRQHSTTLKQLYKELGIPPWLRSTIPFVFIDQQLVAAVGYWIEQDWLAGPKQPALMASLAD